MGHINYQCLRGKVETSPFQGFAPADPARRRFGAALTGSAAERNRNTSRGEGLEALVQDAWAKYCHTRCVEMTSL
jgi:hypothetical protein